MFVSMCVGRNNSHSLSLPGVVSFGWRLRGCAAWHRPGACCAGMAWNVCGWRIQSLERCCRFHVCVAVTAGTVQTIL